MNINRLRGLMETHEMSQADLARAVGATQGSIQQILSGQTLRSRLVPDIARTLGVSVDYLLGHTDDPRSAGLARQEGSPRETLTDERVVGIQEVDISYGMGGGTFIEDYPESDTAYFDFRFVQRLTRAPSTMLFVAKGIGDSMMPTLMDSDMVMVDRSRQQIDAQDRIWAVSYGDLAMIKRIRRLPGDRIHIMSDNPSIAAIEAAADEVRVIGKVIWYARSAG